MSKSKPINSNGIWSPDLPTEAGYYYLARAGAPVELAQVAFPAPDFGIVTRLGLGKVPLRMLTGSFQWQRLTLPVYSGK